MHQFLILKNYSCFVAISVLKNSVSEFRVYVHVCRKEAVTLPDNPDTDFGETEQSLNFSNFNAAMGFQETTYFAMVIQLNSSLN